LLESSFSLAQRLQHPIALRLCSALHQAVHFQHACCASQQQKEQHGAGWSVDYPIVWSVSENAVAKCGHITAAVAR